MHVFALASTTYYALALSRESLARTRLNEHDGRAVQALMARVEHLRNDDHGGEGVDGASAVKLVAAAQRGWRSWLPFTS